MRMQTTLYVIGARFYDIADDKTGEIKRFTTIWGIQPQEADKHDRTGFEPQKIRCANSEVVKKLAGIKLPAEIECQAELSINGKGEAKLIVHDIKVPEVLQAAVRKAA